MKSSIDRFRGTVLGAVLGEGLAIANPVPGPLHPPLSHLKQFQQPGISLPYSHPMLATTALLAQCPPLTIADWQALLNNPLIRTAPTNHPLPLGIVPIALLHHEEPSQLHRALDHYLTLIQASPVSHETSLIIAGVISRALQERLHPSTLVPDLLAELESSPHAIAATCLNQLALVQALLIDHVSLAIALAELHTQGSTWLPLTLALYCFLDTPHDFQLSLRRAWRTQIAPEMTCTLTGIFSGIYNGVADIPAEWRMTLNQLPSLQILSTLPATTSLEAEILVLADRLWATWCGAYLPEHFVTASASLSAIAAPRVIRPR